MKHITRREALLRMALAGATFSVLRKSMAAAEKASPAPKRNMEELRNALRGVHNFMITPFHANYDLDAEGLRKNVAYHTKGSTENMTIVAGGGLGELFTLDLDEHKALATATVAGAQGKMPVVIGIGGGYRLALRMARTAEEAGADAVLAFAPPYGSESAEGAYQYFRAIASSVGIGVIVFPRFTEDYWAAVLKRLCELPNIIGFKDGSDGDKFIKALGPLVPDRLLWIAEGEGRAAQTLAIGARAFSSPVAAFVPNACREFWKRGVSGNVAGMNEIMKARIDPILKVRNVKPGYGISGLKVALEALGRAGGPMRPPGTQVMESDRAALGEIARKHAEIS
ncbi:MAG: hypothetical protein EXS39_06325 [Opitutaceae bacterium]|nr:hypothetical protein [Opitutaceae bacterium]